MALRRAPPVSLEPFRKLKHQISAWSVRSAGQSENKSPQNVMNVCQGLVSQTMHRLRVIPACQENIKMCRAKQAARIAKCKVTRMQPNSNHVSTAQLGRLPQAKDLPSASRARPESMASPATNVRKGGIAADAIQMRPFARHAQ